MGIRAREGISCGPLLLYWVLMCTVGWTVGWLLAWSNFSLECAASLTRNMSSDLVHSIRMLVFGSLLGTAQWLVLRKRLSKTGWWVLAVAIAETAGEITGSRVAFIVDRFRGAAEMDEMSRAALFAWFSTEALFVGIGQWSVLRRKVDRAGWWIPLASFGWCMSYGLGEIVDDLTEGIARWTVVGCLYGIITGIVLAGLLRRDEGTSGKYDR